MVEARNGLHTLKELGIPESAITALLLLCATLTLTPYVAGREFGPYTIPQVLPVSTYWPLALSLPLLWVTLLARAIEPAGVRWKSVGRMALVALGAALPLAILSSPVNEQLEFTALVEPGRASSRFHVDLPFDQRVEVTVEALEGLAADKGVFVTICRGSDKCVSDQRPVDSSPIAGTFPKGRVSIEAFNFAENVKPARVKLAVKYVRRRYL